MLYYFLSTWVSSLTTLAQRSKALMLVKLLPGRFEVNIDVQSISGIRTHLDLGAMIWFYSQTFGCHNLSKIRTKFGFRMKFYIWNVFWDKKIDRFTYNFFLYIKWSRLVRHPKHELKSSDFRHKLSSEIPIVKSSDFGIFPISDVWFSDIHWIKF